MALSESHRHAAHLEGTVEKLCAKIREEQATGNLTYKMANKMITEMGDELSASTISQWKKEAMRSTLKGLKKFIVDADKEFKATLEKQATEKANALIAGLTNSDAVVDVFNAAGHSKALDIALKQFKVKVPNTAVMLFSVDQENNKVICLCIVPTTLSEKGFTANEWVKPVSVVIGGKGGGSDVSAQASGPIVDKLSDAIAVAKEFASSKLQAS